MIKFSLKKKSASIQICQSPSGHVPFRTLPPPYRSQHPIFFFFFLENYNIPLWLLSLFPNATHLPKSLRLASSFRVPFIHLHTARQTTSPPPPASSLTHPFLYFPTFRYSRLPHPCQHHRKPIRLIFFPSRQLHHLLLFHSPYLSLRSSPSPHLPRPPRGMPHRPPYSLQPPLPLQQHLLTQPNFPQLRHHALGRRCPLVRTRHRTPSFLVMGRNKIRLSPRLPPSRIR